VITNYKITSNPQKHPKKSKRRKRVLHFTCPTSIVKGTVLRIPKTKKFKWLVALEQVMEGAKICSSTTNSTLHQNPYLLHI
jgi:hypothetical protein